LQESPQFKPKKIKRKKQNPKQDQETKDITLEQDDLEAVAVTFSLNNA